MNTAPTSCSLPPSVLLPLAAFCSLLTLCFTPHAYAQSYEEAILSPSLPIVPLKGVGTVTGPRLTEGTYAPVTEAMNNYSVARSTGITYVSISAGDTVTSWRNGTNLDDNMSNTQPIGFTFTYNGVPYTGFRVSTSGFLTFNTGSGATGGGTTAYGYQNTQFSAVGGTLNTLAPVYDDLTVPTGGSLSGNIKYKTTGTAPNRILTVEWSGMGLFSTPSVSLTFQAKLYEVDGKIEFEYGTMTAGSGVFSYSLGINAATMSSTPTTAELLTQLTANTASFGSTPTNGLTAIPAENTRISFTAPTTPSDPSDLTFSDVRGASLTLNWSDNSSTETGFPVFISLDDITYTYIGSGAANSSSVGIIGLTPLTTYYFRVFAASEGSMSSGSASGSQATAAGMTGTKSIGLLVEADYATFTAAVADLATDGVGAGGITFEVQSGTYSERFTIGVVGGSSASNPITFSKLSGTVTLNGTGTTATNDAMVTLAGSDFVTFDGIGVTDGGSSTTNQVEYGFLLTSAGGVDGATNNTIKNCSILLGGSGTAPGFSHGILISSGAVSLSGTCNNNKVQSVTVNRSDRGFGSFAPATTLPDDSLEVSHCHFGPSIYIGDSLTTAGGSPIGIILSNATNGRVFNNVVYEVAARHTGATSGPIGISMQGTTGDCYNNTILAVSHANTSSTTARSIGLQCGTLLGGTTRMYNNFISGISRNYTGAATATQFAFGFRSTNFTGGGGTSDYSYNTVYLSRPAPVPYSSVAFGTFAAAVPMITRNNIFINVIGTTSVTARGIAVHDANVAVGNLTSNYNNFFTPGANGAVGMNGASTVRFTLADWQAANAGLDADSKSKTVTFASPGTGDLHLAGGSIGDLDLICSPLSGITTDIDGDLRNSSVPYMGADEDPDDPLPITLSYFTARHDVGSNTVLLRWGTLSEVNNYGFEIQKSLHNQSAYHTVPNSFIPGHGTTNEPQTYEYADGATSLGRWYYRLKQIDLDGTIHYSDGIEVEVVTGVDELAPRVFMLAQNYPNPFNPATEIVFTVEQTGIALLRVYNLLGQEVATLYNGIAEAGKYHRVTFDAKQIATGVYIYRLETDNRSILKKMLLMK